jgi:hypothetical protein
MKRCKSITNTYSSNFVVFRRKFIDQRLNRESDSLDASAQQKKDKPTTVEDEILMKVAEKLSGFKSKVDEELLSNQMLVGIPEVDLGIE